MTFPAFPRHLTPEERSAVREVAARRFADEILEDMVSDLGPIKSTQSREALHGEAVRTGLTLVALNWLSERMDAVEAAQASKGDA